MKKCSKCKQMKDESEFWHDKSRKDGLCIRCKDCIGKYNHSRRGIMTFVKYAISDKGKATKKRFAEKQKNRTAFSPQDICTKCGKYYRKRFSYDNLCDECKGEKK